MEDDLGAVSVSVVCQCLSGGGKSPRAKAAKAHTTSLVPHQD